MTPVHTKACNTVLEAGAELQRCGVADMPIQRTQEGISSFWKPSPAELAALTAGGVVRLTLISLGHPPVSLQVEAP